MLKSKFSLVASAAIPIRWLVVAGIATLSGIAAFFLEKEEPSQVVSMTTTLPSVPRDIFSRRLSIEKNASGDGKLLRGDEETDEWICLCGDKFIHSILSLLLCIDGQARLPKATPESRTAAFELYFQAMVVELRVATLERGRDAAEVDPPLDRLATTILHAPLGELAFCQKLSLLSQEQRAEAVTDAVNDTFAAGAGGRKNFHAAFVLLRVMAVALSGALPRRL